MSLARAKTLNKEAAAACADAVNWLVPQPLEQQSVATLSMLVIALERLQNDQTVAVRALTSLLGSCRKELSGWLATTTAPELMRSLEGTDYVTPDRPEAPRGAPFQFLLYMPHCLAAIAILCSPTLRSRYEHRQFAREVVGILTERICGTGKFVAAGRQMVSTVESLWISRLLVLYAETSVTVSRTRRVLDSLRRRRLVGIIVFGAVVVIGIPFAVVFTSGTLQAILGVASTILLGLVTGVAATLIVDWVKRQ